MSKTSGGVRNPKHHSTFFHAVDISVMSTEHNQPRTLAQENKSGRVFAFAARTRSDTIPCSIILVGALEVHIWLGEFVDVYFKVV